MHSLPHRAGISIRASPRTTFAYWMNSSLFVGLTGVAPAPGAGADVTGKCPVSRQWAMRALLSTKVKIHLAHHVSNKRPTRPAVEPVVAAATVVVPAWSAAIRSLSDCTASRAEARAAGSIVICIARGLS